MIEKIQINMNELNSPWKRLPDLLQNKTSYILVDEILLNHKNKKRQSKSMEKILRKYTHRNEATLATLLSAQTDCKTESFIKDDGVSLLQ